MSLIWALLSLLAMIVAFYLLRLYEVEEECPNCGSKNVTKSKGGKLVCKVCGVILRGRKYDRGREGKRSFDDDRDNVRRTKELEYIGQGSADMMTEISPESDDTGTNSISARFQDRRRRLKKWQRERSKSTAEGNLHYWKKRISAYASSNQLNLPKNVKKEAKKLLQRVQKIGLTNSYSFRRVTEACTFAACRIHGVPRTLTQIVENANTGNTSKRQEKRKVSKAFRRISRELDINPPRISPEKFLPKIVDKVDLDGGDAEILESARQIIKNTGKAVQGKNPDVIAGAAVVLAANKKGINIKQTAVAEACSSSISAISKGKRHLAS